MAGEIDLDISVAVSDSGMDFGECILVVLLILCMLTCESDRYQYNDGRFWTPRCTFPAFWWYTFIFNYLNNTF